MGSSGQRRGSFTKVIQRGRHTCIYETGVVANCSDYCLGPDFSRDARAPATALAELAAGGFERLTFEGVASRAGTGKSAVYRRWQTRQDLAVDAIVHASSPVPTPKMSGDLRTDLFRYFRRFADGLAGPLGVAVHALGSDKSVAAVARDCVLDQRERALRDIVKQHGIVVQPGLDQGPEVRAQQARLAESFK